MRVIFTLSEINDCWQGFQNILVTLLLRHHFNSQSGHMFFSYIHYQPDIANVDLTLPEIDHSFCDI